jgi:hypothetical protein
MAKRDEIVAAAPCCPECKKYAHAVDRLVAKLRRQF